MENFKEKLLDINEKILYNENQVTESKRKRTELIDSFKFFSKDFDYKVSENVNKFKK
jgi:hypothetical protein